jgi:acyl carrier protein
MTKDQILIDVTRIIHRDYNSNTIVTPELFLVEIDETWDSLDRVELLMALEEHFHIEIPDDAFDNFKTIGEIVDYLFTHPEHVQ